MTNKDLQRLQAIFEAWRKTKKTRADRIPDKLLKRARLAAGKYGYGAVLMHTKVTREQLDRSDNKTAKCKRMPKVSHQASSSHKAIGPKKYSNILVPAPMAQVLAEIEGPNGCKLRLYADGGDHSQLIDSFCRLTGW